ncbi:MAG TPA: hypothetical protein VH278_12255 [Burkholderiaceae bacterium]|jgi:hypothetical protein|nr:hypothetical protein [Burkholderiaceae bacterium]
MSTFSNGRSAAHCLAVVTLIAVAALGLEAVALAAEDSSESVNVRAKIARPSDETGPAAAPARSSDEALSAPGKSPKGPPRSLFRCWQDGRIIFEGRGYGALPSSQVAAELKAGDSGTGRLQVLDMYHGLCVLELPK